MSGSNARAEVQWVLTFSEQFRSDFRGSKHALTIVIGLLGILAGVYGWNASGWVCGVSTMVASLALVTMYMYFGERRGRFMG